MTPEKLAELEKLEAAATPGEWGAVLTREGVRWVRGNIHFIAPPSMGPPEDFFLASRLRNNARDLFASLREAWAENKKLKALIRNARVVEPSSMGLSNIYLIDGVDWDRLKAAVEDDI